MTSLVSVILWRLYLFLTPAALSFILTGRSLFTKAPNSAELPSQTQFRPTSISLRAQHVIEPSGSKGCVLPLHVSAGVAVLEWGLTLGMAVLHASCDFAIKTAWEIH